MRVALALILLVAGCTGDDAVATTTTEMVPETTIGIDITSVGPAAVTVDETVDAGLAETLQGDLEALRTTTEEIRGLRFLDPPQIAIVPEAVVATRRDAGIASASGDVDPAIESRLLQMFGQLESGQRIDEMVGQVADRQTTAYYDAAAQELVVGAKALTPYDRSIVVRELVRALTDIYHRHANRITELRNTGRHDEADALATLSDADATYFQLVYIQELPTDQRAAAAAGNEVVSVELPAAVRTKLAFPFEAGVPFIEALVDSGGLAELDLAYGADILTTEQIRHPSRYFAAETVRPVEVPSGPVAGYQLLDSGTWGYASLETLLTGGTATLGMMTQTLDGWGGDAFALHTAGDDLAFIYLYRGDSVDDTLEVAQAFLNLAEGRMNMRSPVNAAGGVEFVGTTGTSDPESEGPYLYVDRESGGLVVILTDDPSVGRTLRDSIPVP